MQHKRRTRGRPPEEKGVLPLLPGGQVVQILLREQFVQVVGGGEGDVSVAVVDFGLREEWQQFLGREIIRPLWPAGALVSINVA